MVSWFFEEFYKHAQGRSFIAVQFHEWVSAITLVLIRTRRLDIVTVLKTYATLKGSYLCSANFDFYNNLDKFRTDTEADDRQTYHGYCVERAAAHSAHVFTTVFEIAALESMRSLGRRPDVITPKGLNVKKLAASNEFQNSHSKARKKLTRPLEIIFMDIMILISIKTVFFLLQVDMNLAIQVPI